MSYNDPLATADEVAERGSFVYGQAQVQGAYVTLRKGVGKNAWVEGQDSIEDRRTEVSIVISPLAESGYTGLITRSMIAESAEYSRVVWPSLRDACGLKTIRDIDNKFVKAEFVKSGRKWTDKKTNEEREGTTLKFHAIFATEAECVAAFTGDGYTARTATASDNGPAGDIDMTPNANNPEREAAKQFLGALVKQANGNKDALGTMLSTMPMITKYFSVDSPEVAEMMKVAA